MDEFMCVQVYDNGQELFWDRCAGLQDAMFSLVEFVKSFGGSNVETSLGPTGEFYVHYDAVDPFAARVHLHMKIVRSDK